MWVQKTITIPGNYYVGDSVEMRVIVRTRFETLFPQLSAPPAWGTISDLRIEQDGEDATIVFNFIAYEAGTLTIPSILLGDFQISGLSIFVSSILEQKGNTFYGPMPQLLLPFTHLYIFLIVCFLVIMPVIFTKGWKFVRRLWQKIRKWVRKRRPWRMYHRNIARLQSRLENVPEREFYIMFTQLIREYLTISLSEEFISATSQEIDEILKSHGVASSVALNIKELMIAGDLVKFAQQRMQEETKQQHIQSATTALLEIQTLIEKKER